MAICSDEVSYAYPRRRYEGSYQNKRDNMNFGLLLSAVGFFIILPFYLVKEIGLFGLGGGLIIGFFLWILTLPIFDNNVDDL